jgi:hypothetical protein
LKLGCLDVGRLDAWFRLNSNLGRFRGPDDALEQLVKVAKERFETKQVKLLGSRRAQKRLAELALEQGLEIAEERQR